MYEYWIIPCSTLGPFPLARVNDMTRHGWRVHTVMDEGVLMERKKADESQRLGPL